MCCRIPNEFLLSERLLPSDNLSNEFSFLLSVRNARRTSRSGFSPWPPVCPARTSRPSTLRSSKAELGAPPEPTRIPSVEALESVRPCSSVPNLHNFHGLCCLAHSIRPTRARAYLVQKRRQCFSRTLPAGDIVKNLVMPPLPDFVPTRNCALLDAARVVCQAAGW